MGALKYSDTIKLIAAKSSVSDNLITFVTSTKGGMQHKPFAKMNEQASDNFDGQDAYSLFSDNENMVEMDFNVNDRKVLSNNFAQLPYETEINFRALADKEVTLSAKSIPFDMAVSIVDVANGTETLLNDADITFTADKGDNNGKYKMKFVSTKNSVTDVAQADVRVFNDNNVINIYGNGLQNAEVMNTLGQVVYNKEISGKTYNFTLNANAGAYVVKVKTAN